MKTNLSIIWRPYINVCKNVGEYLLLRYPKLDIVIVWVGAVMYDAIHIQV